MNQTDLLDQFVVEARECLEAIGTRLLDVERDPHDAGLVNDLFRSVHTLKGNCGLFEFGPLERVVHAGEDVLDRVRGGTLAYSSELADALLDAMDHAAQLIDQIERLGCIDDAADDRSVTHAAALRSLLGAGTSPERAPTVRAPVPESPAAAAPDWLQRLEPDWAAAGPQALAVRYLPESGCFFKGEDPWRLAATTPGLLQLRAAGHQPWPAGAALAEWDCYQCNLDIVLVTNAPRTEVDEHFRCVPEQVSCFAAAPTVTATASPAESAVRQLAATLWAGQCDLLARAGSSGAVIAARSALRGLLESVGDAAASSDLAELDVLGDAAAPVVLAWARAHGPQSGGSTRPDPTRARLPVPAAADKIGDPGRASIDEGTASQPQKTLKVSQERIDRLMELTGEMVVAKNSLPYLAKRAEEVFHQRELAREIKAQYAVINRIAEDMQQAVMQVRMLPVGAVFQRFGRLVRDISRKLGKEVELVIEGEETEADKNVIEPLADPLIHILRNSLDHGIELPDVRRSLGKPATGTIRIVARQESDRVVIEITDDGAGVDAARVRAKAVERGLIPADRAGQLSDAEAVQLIFLPGFSTADAISDLSGRGVGMDVVRTAIERINGAVELSSALGKGTTIRLTLPLSMAVTQVMVVESAGRRLGVPMDLIVETVRVHADDVHHFKRTRTTVLRGRVVPLRALNELLALDIEPLCNDEGELAVLVVRIGHQNVGLLVDRFHGASDIILKPLEGVLAGLVGFAGTALMGDGSVLMVLNTKELL